MDNPENRDAFYRSIFDKYDRDKNGVLDLRELKRIIRDNDDYDNDIPKHAVEQIFELADEDNSGSIDYDEFLSMIQHPQLRYYFKNYWSKYVSLLTPRQRSDGRGDFDVVDGSGAYEEQYSCYPPPLSMIIFSIIEVLCFLYDHLKDPVAASKSAGPLADVFMYDPVRKQEVWRFLTYMFVHNGYAHLVTNVILQLLLALPLEMVHNWWRILTVYFSGVVAGSLFTSITDRRVRLVGASGGVYAILTCHIATIFLNWSEMTLPLVQFIIFMLIAVCDCGNSMYERYYGDSTNAEKIGYEAHFGGAIAGVCVGVLVLKNLQWQRHEKLIWWACLIFVCLSTITMVAINISIPI